MFTVLHQHMLTVGVLSLAFAAAPISAFAGHSWGSYHWARTANPFSLQLGDNVSIAWDAYLVEASMDWNTDWSGSTLGPSSVLATRIVVGGTLGNVRKCRATNGRVEVCNTTYGNNGWLGVAQIWISGSHITQGIVKLNDTYFNTAKYNTAAWRRLVMCQEIGHTFGLDHQDENFSNVNLGTCMDYASNPEGNEHPNGHDSDQLDLIYSHLDGTNTSAQTTAAAPARPAIADMDLAERAQWGRLVRSRNGGQTEVYEADFGGGHKVFTFVIWAQGRERGPR
jgi:hypothetical protein